MQSFLICKELLARSDLYCVAAGMLFLVNNDVVYVRPTCGSGLDRWRQRIHVPRSGRQLSQRVVFVGFLNRTAIHKAHGGIQMLFVSIFDEDIDDGFAVFVSDLMEIYVSKPSLDDHVFKVFGVCDNMFLGH